MQSQGEAELKEEEEAKPETKSSYQSEKHSTPGTDNSVKTNLRATVQAAKRENFLKQQKKMDIIICVLVAICCIGAITRLLLAQNRV